MTIGALRVKTTTAPKLLYFMKKLSKSILVITVVIVFAFFVNGCQNSSNVLVWVVPDLFVPSDACQRRINDHLKESGLDYSVKFVGIQSDFDNTYTQKVLEYIDSGEKADIIFSGSPDTFSLEPYNSAYYRFYKLGIFEPLTQFMDSELGQELINMMPEQIWDTLKIDGKIYGVNGALTSLNADTFYLVNHKYNIPKHDIEYNNMYEVIREANLPDHVAPLRFHSDYLSYKYCISGCTYLTESVFISADNEIECCLTNSDYIDYIKRCKNLQEDAILVNANGDDNIYDEYYLSIDNIIGGNCLYYSYNEQVEDAEYYLIPAFSGGSLQFSNLATGVYAGSDNKKEAFEVLALSQLNSDINDLLVFGMEGEDYKLEEGRIRESTSLENMRIFPFGNRMICHPFQFETKTKADLYKAAYKNARVYDSFGFVFDDSNVKREVVATNAAIREFTEAVLSTDVSYQNIDTLVEECYNKLKELGVEKIVHEAKEQYEKF